jgi:hypothetical protein
MAPNPKAVDALRSDLAGLDSKINAVEAQMTSFGSKLGGVVSKLDTIAEKLEAVLDQASVRRVRPCDSEGNDAEPEVHKTHKPNKRQRTKLKPLSSILALIPTAEGAAIKVRWRSRSVA